MSFANRSCSPKLELGNSARVTLGRLSRYQRSPLYILGTNLVLPPSAIFSKTKMLKGCFLGAAQYTGDAFCFPILTQPESDADSSPQVLARSVI